MRYPFHLPNQKKNSIVWVRYGKILIYTADGNMNW